MILNPTSDVQHLICCTLGIQNVHVRSLALDSSALKSYLHKIIQGPERGTTATTGKHAVREPDSAWVVEGQLQARLVPVILLVKLQSTISGFCLSGMVAGQL